MASLEQAKAMAKELQEILGKNHVSTMVYGQFLEDAKGEAQGNIPLLIVVKKFDETSSLKIYKVLKRWMDVGIETPYIAELDDLSGMLDSIPAKLMDIKGRYQVLEGDDILEFRSEPEFEYLRAQAELEIRRNIYNLRHDLIEVMLRRIPIDRYLKSLSITCLSSIRSFHRITRPDIGTNNQHLEYFYREFPSGQKPLVNLLECIYSTHPDPEETDLLELITEVIDEVFQPMLIKIDHIGKEIIDYKLKRVEDIVEAKSREMKLEMIKEKMKLVKQRKDVKAYEETKLHELADQKKVLETQIKQIGTRETKKHPSEDYKQSREPTRRFSDLDEDIPYPSEEMVYVLEEGKETKKRDFENIPVHEKELSIFEKILYENKTLKNTVRKQKDRRRSV
jgi:hypothetical protein